MPSRFPNAAIIPAIAADANETQSLRCPTRRVQVEVDCNEYEYEFDF